MAKRTSRIRNSSEISFVPDVFCVSYNEPMPIDPPNTSYLTAMPELRTILPGLASKEEQSESRWKPLMGTPSKPPVPPNILVPDPSPIRDEADDKSPRMLTPSSPDSFIHRRRQGEYVPRPPVWKIYELPINDHSSPNGLENTDTDAESCDSDEDVFTDVKSHNMSYMRPAGISVAEQVRKMAEIFSETPGSIIMTEHADLASKPAVLAQRFDYQNLQGNADELLDVASNDMIRRSRSTGSSRNCSAKSNLLKNLHDNAAKLNQEPTVTLRANQEDPEFLEKGLIGVVGSETHILGAHISFHQAPQLFLDFIQSQINNITSCTNIQPPEEIQKPTISGYLVTFIGDTTFSASHLDGQPKPDDKNELMIAIIYDDGWGLFIKRDSGGKLTYISNATLKGSSCEAEDATIEVVYDEKLFHFLPLCSVSSSAESRYKEADLLADGTKAYSRGGKIRPPPRAHSMAAEAEAKDKGVVVISEAVFKSFKCSCEKPRSSLNLPADISVFRQSSAESSKTNDSGQALPVEPHGAGVSQKLNEKKVTRLQRSYGRNLFFARGNSSDPKSKPAYGYGMRQPIGLEGYRTRKKAANKILRQSLEQRQREEEGQGVEEVAKSAQSEAQRTMEQENTDGQRDTPGLLHMVSNWLQHPDHDAGEGPFSTVAETASDQRPSDETAVNSPEDQRLSISTSNNRTVVSWRKIPQENGDIRPDDCKSKKGQGHPETVKENKPFPMRSIGKSIKGGLRGMRSKLSLPRGRVSPGPVSEGLTPKVKPNGLPTVSNDCSEEEGHGS